VGDPRRRHCPMSIGASTKRAMPRTRESVAYLMPGETDPVAFPNGSPFSMERCVNP
jgi:hypothetical protein